MSAVARAPTWSGWPSAAGGAPGATCPPGRPSGRARLRGGRGGAAGPAGCSPTRQGAAPPPVALERARAHAGESGVADRTSWLQLDLLGDDPLPGDADLVSAMYIHIPEADFDRVYTRIAEAVRPGGTLLVAGHNPGERDTDL